MRAEKRIVNAKKELVKLKKIAAKLHGTKENQLITKESLESTIPDIKVHDDLDAMQVESNSDTESSCEMQDSLEKVSKKEQMRINNQWMNQRKIKSIKSKIKKHNQKKTRKGKSAGLSSRKAKKSVRRWGAIDEVKQSNQ